MWTLFLLLNFMYYLLDYSTKSCSNLMKPCMQIYTYHSYVFLQIIRSFYSFIIEKYKMYHKHTIFCIFLIFYIQISTIILQIVLSSVFKQFRIHPKIYKYLTAFQTQTLYFAYHNPDNLFPVCDWN